VPAAGVPESSQQSHAAVEAEQKRDRSLMENRAGIVPGSSTSHSTWHLWHCFIKGTCLNESARQSMLLLAAWSSTCMRTPAGWCGGSAGGGGVRISLAHTRAIIAAIHSGELAAAQCVETPLFKLQVRPSGGCTWPLWHWCMGPDQALTC
jgi:hypothetical protein